MINACGVSLVVFSIEELDPDMTDSQYLLADKAKDKPLFGSDGAFRMVIL